MTASYHTRKQPARRIPDARLRHLARRLHALGERPLYELLRELAAGADLIERLEVYADLPGDLIAAFNGDRLPELRAIDRKSVLMRAVGRSPEPRAIPGRNCDA